MNRAARRLRLFDSQDDYQDFLACVAMGLERVPTRLLAFCVMPNHFHFILWPTETGQMSRFMKVVTGSHSKRWHFRRGSTGTGCVYQGRFRAIPIQQDAHFLTACRYVERNALRASLVERAEDWPWSSLHQRCRNVNVVRLHTWPIQQPANWLEVVNRSEDETAVDAIRTATNRGRAFGSPAWQASFSQRPAKRGRPRKKDVG